MPVKPTVPAVVFDIGGVLTTSEGGVPELSDLIGVERERFAGPYWAHRADYDRGTSPREYWAKVAATSAWSGRTRTSPASTSSTPGAGCTWPPAGWS